MKIFAICGSKRCREDSCIRWFAWKSNTPSITTKKEKHFVSKWNSDTPHLGQFAHWTRSKKAFSTLFCSFPLLRSKLEFLFLESLKLRNPISVSRSASLAHVNSMLREQLDQATAANESLTGDIHKVTQEWQRAREELETKESEWREEEQVTPNRKKSAGHFH